MRTTLAALFLTLFAAFAPAAHAWELDAMNTQIEQTNFIVDERCSGTLIDVEQRLILTNNHCVEHKVKVITEDKRQQDGTVKKVTREIRESIPVSQKAYDDFMEVGASRYVADIVARKEERDLALLQLRQTTIPHTVAAPLLPASGKIVRGEPVWIVGNPAMNDASLVGGVVSNVNRALRFADKNEDIPMIQFSGGIFGGNSGGALYNDDGHLIGVPAAKHFWADFLGYAVPINEVKAALREWCFASVFEESADDDACRVKNASAEEDE